MSNLISLLQNSIQGSVPFLVNILLKTPFPLISYFWTYHLKLLANGNVIFFFGCPPSLKHFFLFTAFPFILHHHVILYIIVLGGDHSIPSSTETN